MNIGEKKEFIGYVGEYSDTWLFETNKTPYSSIVVLAIDELLGIKTKDCEKYKITIEKLEAEMKLTHRYDNDPELNDYLSHEYHCELTKELDDLAGFDKKMIDEYEYGHYILATEADMKQRLLYIRIPGGTVGNIFLDKTENIITKITIDTDYVVDSYPENVQEYVQKYIGDKIEIFD